MKSGVRPKTFYEEMEIGREIEKELVGLKVSLQG